MSVLDVFAEETESNVIRALENIEVKLEQPDNIGIYAYRKLAYYETYVAYIVGFDSSKSCDLMIRNIRGKGKEAKLDSRLFLFQSMILMNLRFEKNMIVLLKN